MANAITIPSLQVNGVYWAIVPNSFSYRRGVGTVDVKAEVVGGVATPVFQVNKTGAVGYITFMMEPTDTNLSQVDVAQDNSPNNTVQFTQDGFTKTMPTAAITADPDRALGADKNFTVEFEGAEIA